MFPKEQSNYVGQFHEGLRSGQGLLGIKGIDLKTRFQENMGQEKHWNSTFSSVFSMGIQKYQKIYEGDQAKNIIHIYKGVKNKYYFLFSCYISQPQARKKGTEKWRTEEIANEGMRNWRWGNQQPKRKERTNREEINKQIESNKIKKARKRWRMKKGRKARNENQYCFCDSLDMFWSCWFCFLLIRHPLVVFATGFMRVFSSDLCFYLQAVKCQLIGWLQWHPWDYWGWILCDFTPQHQKPVHCWGSATMSALEKNFLALPDCNIGGTFPKENKTKCSKHVSTGAFHSVLVSGMFLILLQQPFPIFAVI